MYYEQKREILQDVFGAPVSLGHNWLSVRGRRYPIIDDVIILLGSSPDQLSGDSRNRTTDRVGRLTEEIRSSFGQEWRAFSKILPEHAEEFRSYFDLVHLSELATKRVCDLGCGIGRSSTFLAPRCRELILVDFSDSIFLARKNLAHANNVIFLQADIRHLPFRDDFADLIVCLGVLHHLPVPALDELRSLSRYSKRWLVYLYYNLENRPAYYRALLAAVTQARRVLRKVRSQKIRNALTWALALGIYVPILSLGRVVDGVEMGKYIPLFETYSGKSMVRIRQDVYDRFFTPIEQRFKREEILGLRDTFAYIEVSEEHPYWHFLCERR